MSVSTWSQESYPAELEDLRMKTVSTSFQSLCPLKRSCLTTLQLHHGFKRTQCLMHVLIHNSILRILEIQFYPWHQCLKSAFNPSLKRLLWSFCASLSAVFVNFGLNYLFRAIPVSCGRQFIIMTQRKTNFLSTILNFEEGNTLSRVAALTSVVEIWIPW